MSVHILRQKVQAQLNSGFSKTSILHALKIWPIYFIVPVCLLMLWWVSAEYAWMPAQILPAPKQVWWSLQDLWLHQDLLEHSLISLQRYALGVLAGTIFGLAFGMLLGYSPRAEQYLSASFYALAIIPTLAWLPLLMIWLGIEEALKVFLIFKAVFIPIAIHVQAGVRDIQPKLQEVVKVLQLKRIQQFQYLIFPSVLVYFFTGLRIALAAGWTTLIAVELIASSEGVGYLMVMGRQLFQLDIVFVMIAVIALIGLFIDNVIGRLEAKVLFWPNAALSTQALKPRPTALIPWVIPAGLVSVWWLSAQYAGIDQNLLPHPIAVVQALWTELLHGELLQALLESLSRAFQGLLIGCVSGIVVGVLIGLFQPLALLFAPTLNTLRLIAIFAWIPLLTAWFGLGDLSKTIFIALATFFPMFVATWQGVKNVSPVLQETALVFHLNPIQRVQKLILPSITPSIFSGFRLALLYAWMASFGAEYLMASGVGVGTYMMTAQQSFEMDRVMAATILVAILGVVFAWIGKKSEQSATRWRQHVEGIK